MAMIADIRHKVNRGKFEFTRHAIDRMFLREISVIEVREAINSGEIIEDYPEDKFGPSCLIFGLTRRQRPLHIQCSYPMRTLLKVITVYQPDPDEWLDHRIRR